jgi:hypothetical protein
MFAGEGDAWHLNVFTCWRRYAGQWPTAFDSVTLYGNDPAIRQ